MTIKYLYCLGVDNFEKEFDFLHIPIDNYVEDIASDKFGLKKPTTKWSRWEEKDYKVYQEELRKKIVDSCHIAPLRWEFSAWLKAARNLSQESENEG